MRRCYCADKQSSFRTAASPQGSWCRTINSAVMLQAPQNSWRKMEHRMRGWLAAAGVNGFLAVAMGALGAHLLQGRLSAHGINLIETASRYQMAHALALFGVAWLATARPGAMTQAGGFAFLAGIVFFSGSLYGLALTGIDSFAILAPFGGFAFMLGWLALVAAALRR